MNIAFYTVLAVGAGLPKFATKEEATAFAESCNGIVIPVVDVEVADILKEVE